MSLVFLSNSTHDAVIRSSASTYNPAELSNLGLEITLNLSSQKNRFVGPASTPVYPEIVVWRPDYKGADTGQAVIVEAIETAATINLNSEKWRILSSLGIQFNLVIPEKELQNLKRLLADNSISSVNIQTYRFIPTQNKYIFTSEKS